MIKKTIPLKLHNRYDVFIRKSWESPEADKQIAQGENLILNGLWERLLVSTHQAYGTSINFGTGTGTLAATRTTLFTQLDYKSGTGETFSYADSYVSRRISIQLLEHEYVGSTITEVGLSSGGSTIYTHALLKDMNGNQTSIPKASTDIITIYATVYLVFPESGWHSGSVKIFRPLPESTAHSTILKRLLGGIHANDWMAYGRAISFYVGGSDMNRLPAKTVETTRSSSPPVTFTFDVANKKMSIYGRLGASAGNVMSGLGTVCVTETGGNTGIFLFLSDTGGWHSDSVIGEAIGTGDGVTTDFSTVFPFVQDGAVFKADGAPVTASLLTAPPRISDLSAFMIPATGSTIDHCLPNIIRTGSIVKSDGYWENPFYETVGIEQVTLTGTLYSSADNVNWSIAAQRNIASPGVVSVNAGNQHHRYWKASPYISGVNYYFECHTFVCPDALSAKNIRFTSPPAVGAALTADYTTKVIPKDVNHVYDITIELTFAEYTP